MIRLSSSLNSSSIIPLWRMMNRNETKSEQASSAAMTVDYAIQT